MADWKDTFPLPNISSYKLNPQQAFIRTNMEAGPARQRRIFSTPYTNATVSFIFPNSDLFSEFEQWWINDIYHGAMWFVMPIKDGSGINYWDTRFSAPYEASPITGADDTGWVVSGNIEIKYIPVITVASNAFVDGDNFWVDNYDNIWVNE